MTSRPRGNTRGQDIPTIVDSVFFTAPGRLPRGRHSLSREQIDAAQRERLLIAMTELIAAQGYSAVSVADVVARATVSRAVFYRTFTDKEGCALSAYDRFIDVLLTGLIDALSGGSNDLRAVVSDSLLAYLKPIHDDPVVGRAFQVEIDSMGSTARSRRRKSLALFANAVRHEHVRLHELRAAGEPLPYSAYLGAVYAVRQLASDAIDSGRAADILDDIPEITAWLLRLLNGEAM